METLTRPVQLEQQMPVVQDQDPLAKLGFGGIDPRFSDVAYHFTREDRLDGIRQEGLRYANEIDKGKNWLAAADQELMGVKPPGIAVDLKHVVFGQIEQRHLGSNKSPALRTDTEKGESLAVAIDPQDTYVGDARMREELAGAPKYGTKMMGGNIPALRQYFWKNVMTLPTFKELYKPVSEQPDSFGTDYVSWELKDPANEAKLGVSSWVEIPELYIPLDTGEDTIGTERLRHTASSRVGRDPIELAKAQEVADATIKAEQQKELERQQEIISRAQRFEEAAQKREQKELERQELERQHNEKIASYGGSLGLQLAELYIDHNNATDQISAAGTVEERQRAITDKDKNLKTARSLLSHGLARKHVEQHAISDANASGHDLNFGGEYYPASK